MPVRNLRMCQELISTLSVPSQFLSAEKKKILGNFIVSYFSLYAREINLESFFLAN